nr:hypothetical protein [Tanacetum cinerariifolium]
FSHLTFLHSCFPIVRCLGLFEREWILFGEKVILSLLKQRVKWEERKKKKKKRPTDPGHGPEEVVSVVVHGQDQIINSFDLFEEWVLHDQLL